ncbi:hypothetical protein ACFQRB_13135 [Halobaculum litoreum]|uniref:Uncharacterized protein n=1 Tax=Halobaculum litoreum TaxID=3031998 RepID=A0ABD5XTZ7_9EURY
MITNREIASSALLNEALDEVVESAVDNGFERGELAAVFRDRAAALEAEADGDGAAGVEAAGVEADGVDDGA